MLDALKETDYGLVVQPFFDTIAVMEKQVKQYERELRRVTEGEHTVELLKSIPGCGEITAWTIRAFTDDIKRFASPKKFVSYAGLAPWVQSSNETVHLGRITKRGPEELRTALVQLVMGLVRIKKKTVSWRIMERYEVLKRHKGSGKSIVATARKLAVIIWHMLSEDKPFDISHMIDKSLALKAEGMREASFEDKSAVAKRVVKPELKPAGSVTPIATSLRKKKSALPIRKKLKIPVS